MAEKLILHAALGGLIAQARGESFASGAIAGGVAEGLTPIANGLLADFVSSRFDASDLSGAGSQLKIGTAQIIGLIAAGVAGGNPVTGSLIGGTAEKYNDQGFHLDPTNSFDDDELPIAEKSEDPRVKGSLLLLGLIPGFWTEELAAGIGGFLSRNFPSVFGMFSEATEGTATPGSIGGTVDTGVGAGEAPTGGAVGSANEIPPGMTRPFRPLNPDYPPDESVVEAMGSENIQKMSGCKSTDCSEIAEKLLDAAGGKGKIIEVRPNVPGSLETFENGELEGGQVYHQVYTDGKYVYDPRLSSEPIPQGDWIQHIRGMNPRGVTISDKLGGLK
jgi:hypothetical protein